MCISKVSGPGNVSWNVTNFVRKVFRCFYLVKAKNLLLCISQNQSNRKANNQKLETEAHKLIHNIPFQTKYLTILRNTKKGAIFFVSNIYIAVKLILMRFSILVKGTIIVTVFIKKNLKILYPLYYIHMYIIHTYIYFAC